MKVPKYRFMMQRIGDTDRLWLEELSKPGFDERVSRVRLGTKLPPGFDPKLIDRKLCLDSKLTLIGLWHVAPKAPIFSAVSALVSSIRERMTSDPYRTDFPLEEIAESTHLAFSLLRDAVDELQRIPTYAPIPALFDRVTKRTSGEMTLFVDSATTAEPFLTCSDSDTFLEWLWAKLDVFQRSQAPAAPPPPGADSAGQVPIRPGTAFVLMAMDPRKPELDDVYSAIRSVCADFGLDARRADKFEHDELITDLILREIRTSEFLIADLTHERPNVYYEVGYAHALKKRPILFRREGTTLHFDLAVHNAREYRNLEQLKELLHRRLAAIFDKEPRTAHGTAPSGSRRKKQTAKAMVVAKQVKKQRRSRSAASDA